jgi:hypothetical protein
MVREFDLKLKVTLLALGFTTQKELHRHFLEIAPTLGLEQDNLYKWMQGRSTPRSSQVYEHWAAMLRLDAPLSQLKNCSIDEFVEALSGPYDLDPAVVATVIGRPVRPSAASQGAANDPAEAWRNHLPGTFACYSHAFSPIFRGKIMRGALTIAAPDPAAALEVSYIETTPFTQLTHRGALSWNNRLIGLELRDQQKGSHLHMTLHCPSAPASTLTGLMVGPSFHDATPQPTVTRVLAIRVPTFDLAALGGPDCVFDPRDHSIAAELVLMGLGVVDPKALNRLFADFFAGGERSGFDQISVDESARVNFALDLQLAGVAARRDAASEGVVLPFQHK